MKSDGGRRLGKIWDLGMRVYMLFTCADVTGLDGGRVHLMPLSPGIVPLPLPDFGCDCGAGRYAATRRRGWRAF